MKGNEKMKKSNPTKKELADRFQDIRFDLQKTLNVLDEKMDAEYDRTGETDVKTDKMIRSFRRKWLIV
jgi:hypothetical protein